MGASYSVLSEEEITALEESTFFRRRDILRIHKYFYSLSRGADHLTKEAFCMIPEVFLNPFSERIAHVFSNEEAKVTFTDFVDFLSVFSEDATPSVKIFYAFLIYDFDGDEYIGRGDMEKLVDCLVSTNLSSQEKKMIVDSVFAEADIDGDESLSYVEFEHILSRCPDFLNTFRIRF